MFAGGEGSGIYGKYHTSPRHIERVPASLVTLRHTSAKPSRTHRPAQTGATVSAAMARNFMIFV